MIDTKTLISGMTPGPWRYVEPEGSWKPAVQRGAEGGFSVHGMSSEREIADAKAISMLPEIIDELDKTREALITLLRDVDWACGVGSTLPENTFAISRNAARAALAEGNGQEGGG